MRRVVGLAAASGLCAVLSLPAATPVGTHGALSVEGNRIVDQHGEAVSLAGASFFWSNTHWGGERFYRDDVVGYLQEDWGVSIIRAAMGVEESDGYLTSTPNRDLNVARVETLVESALARGLYVIIDWHTHRAEDHPDAAVEFFVEMARKYGERVNVLYEIYNEPLGSASWAGDVKPYAERVIAAIREVDPDNLILVGSPTWSQRPDFGATDPITGYGNLVYTFHFYAGTHAGDPGGWVRQNVQKALDAGVAVMSTEWGATTADGGQPVQGVIQPIAREQADHWLEFMRQNDISHLNWAVNNKAEGASIFKSTASPSAGQWTDADLTESGLYVKNAVQNWHVHNYASPDEFQPFVHWLQSFGLPGDSDPHDPTGKNWSLLAAYAQVISPFQERLPLPCFAAPDSSGNWTIALPRSQTDVQYTLQRSTDLVQWEDLASTTGTGAAIDFPLPLPDAELTEAPTYFRILFTLPST